MAVRHATTQSPSAAFQNLTRGPGLSISPSPRRQLARVRRDLLRHLARSAGAHGPWPSSSSRLLESDDCLATWPAARYLPSGVPACGRRLRRGWLRAGAERRATCRRVRHAAHQLEASRRLRYGRYRWAPSFIELHGVHGYLILSVMRPTSLNERTDEYRACGQLREPDLPCGRGRRRRACSMPPDILHVAHRPVIAHLLLYTTRCLLRILLVSY